MSYLLTSCRWVNLDSLRRVLSSKQSPTNSTFKYDANIRMVHHWGGGLTLLGIYSIAGVVGKWWGVDVIHLCNAQLWRRLAVFGGTIAREGENERSRGGEVGEKEPGVDMCHWRWKESLSGNCVLTTVNVAIWRLYIAKLITCTKDSVYI